MKAFLRSVLVAVVTICVGAAHASTNSSEITDMWWNPAESGWGVNIVLQNDVAFMTFFVYDSQRHPVWYTSDVHFQGANGAGALVWTGNLYATEGPWFGGSFTPNATSRPGGTVTFALSSLNQATLTYSVDGVPVTKSLQRQTWTNEDYSGTYAGGYSIRQYGCNPASLNGTDEQVGSISISQTGSSVTFILANSAGTCTFSGTYTQTGKLGRAQGTYSCSNTAQGTFNAVEMTPTISGFTARVSGQNQYCQWSGYLGGIVRAQ